MHLGKALELPFTKYKMVKPESLHMEPEHLMMQNTSTLPTTAYGYKFHVVTDSNPLTYLVTSAKLSATDHRWLSGLAAFDFTIT